MAALEKKVIPALLIAGILGGIEMRVTLARLEQRITDIDRRVENLEESKRRTALVSED